MEATLERQAERLSKIETLSIQDLSWNLKQKLRNGNYFGPSEFHGWGIYTKGFGVESRFAAVWEDGSKGYVVEGSYEGGTLLDLVKEDLITIEEEGLKASKLSKNFLSGEFNFTVRTFGGLLAGIPACLASLAMIRAL